MVCFVFACWFSLYSYDGRCPDFFDASSKECSRMGYLRFNFLFLFIVVVFLGRLWSLLILLLPPFLGLLIGVYKQKTHSDERYL